MLSRYIWLLSMIRLLLLAIFWIDASIILGISAVLTNSTSSHSSKPFSLRKWLLLSIDWLLSGVIWLLSGLIWLLSMTHSLPLAIFWIDSGDLASGKLIYFPTLKEKRAA